MPAEGIPGYLKYRVLNQNTGAVVIPDLPHLHESSWTVMALQTGSPGAGTIGNFRIPLHPPSSKEEYGKAKQFYDLLAPGQKIEGYLGDVITGTPKFSGVLTTDGFKKNFATFEIGGADTLWWLQQSQLFQSEILAAPVGGLALVQSMMGTQEVTWDDDFSLWNSSTHPNSSDYTNTSGWTFTSSDPYLRLPALSNNSINPTIGRLVTTTSFTAAQFLNASAITIHGTMSAGTDTGADACEASILFLSDSTAQNGVMARAVMIQTGVGTGLYNVYGQIHTISGGAYTQQASSPSAVFSNVLSVFPFEVTMLYYKHGTQPAIRVLINGKDAGIEFGVTPPASGGIGLRFSPLTGGSPIVYVNRIQFHYRTGNVGTNRFAAGSQSSLAQGTTQDVVGSGQTHLDMMLLAMGMDGFRIRKNAGAGFKADTLDYNSSPGSDLSASIRFEEGVNLEDLEVGPVAEGYSTDAKLTSLPGVSSGGSITWGRIGAAGDMVLTDTVTDVGIPGYSLLVGYAEALQGRKAVPWNAKKAIVIRDRDTVDKWRELDTVLVDSPSLNVQKQKMLILGYTFTEGLVTQQVFLDQFPQSATPIPAQRLARVVESISSTYATR